MTRVPQSGEMDIRWTYSDIGGGPPGRALPAVTTTLRSGLLQLDVRLGCWCHFTGTRSSNHPHRHLGFYEVCLIAAGSGTLCHGKHTYALRAGDLTTADPGIVHEIRSPSGDLELAFFTVALRGVAGPDAPWEAEVLEQFRRRHRVHSSGQHHLLAHLELLRASGPAATWRRRQTLSILALECLAVLGEAPPQRLSDEPPVGDAVARACAWIDAHCDRAVSVAELARAAGLSERQLRRHFISQLKRTPLAEISHRRLQAAAAHLLMGASAAEAGRAIGIADPSQFSRDFRRRWGLTPSLWVARHRPRAATRTEHTPRDTGTSRHRFRPRSD